MGLLFGGGLEAIVVQACGRGLPLEIVDLVICLNLDPERPCQHGLSNQLRVIAWSYNKLVAVLRICVFKWDLVEGLLSLF